jgi:DNA-nicking Smr family endonuclease
VKRDPKASSIGAEKERTRPSDSDDDDLARAMTDVVPLKRDRPDRVPLDSRAHLANAHARAPQKSADNAEQIESTYVAPGVDRRELRKLKRGEYAVRHRLDLHGLAADDAVARVTRFIENSRHARHRAICIVHGRGLHSEGGVAVLKARVRAGLRAHREVLAFTDAPPEDGGAGAVYVLLRK